MIAECDYVGTRGKQQMLKSGKRWPNSRHAGDVAPLRFACR
ncbi:MAG: hypothetical protein ABSE06_09385 [Anaerolineaceae bacterium]